MQEPGFGQTGRLQEESWFWGMKHNFDATSRQGSNKLLYCTFWLLQDIQVCLAVRQRASHLMVQICSQSNEYRLKGSVRYRKYTSNKTRHVWEPTDKIRQLYRWLTGGHTLSVFGTLFSCRGSGGADAVCWGDHLTVGLNVLHRFHQAAAGQHHVAGGHVFGLQLPESFLAVPDPVAKIYKKTWEQDSMKHVTAAKPQTCNAKSWLFWQQQMNTQLFV